MRTHGASEATGQGRFFLHLTDLGAIRAERSLMDDVRPDARVEGAPFAERLDDGKSVGSFVDLIAQRTHDAHLDRVRGEPVACHVEPLEEGHQVGEELHLIDLDLHVDPFGCPCRKR